MEMQTSSSAVKKIPDFTIDGKHKKPILIDITYPDNNEPKPVVIFCHGFKGFKDWGHFNLAAERFAQEGFVFVKFNFSHNGTTPEKPLEFADLKAFSNNNFTIELDDLSCVINHVKESESLKSINTDSEQLFLAGHSRGGSIAIVRASEDPLIKKLVTWSAVSDIEKSWTKEVVEGWKAMGTIYVENARTNQQMPIDYQICENYFANRERLYLPNAAKKIAIPFLVIHGTKDESVPYQSAIEINQWNPKSKLFSIEGANHVFGAKHPWESPELPADAAIAIEKSIEFFKSKFSTA